MRERAASTQRLEAFADAAGPPALGAAVAQPAANSTARGRGRRRERRMAAI
jgi:hypothetical protein